jgi:hypothetical protein
VGGRAGDRGCKKCESCEAKPTPAIGAREKSENRNIHKSTPICPHSHPIHPLFDEKEAYYDAIVNFVDRKMVFLNGKPVQVKWERGLLWKILVNICVFCTNWLCENDLIKNVKGDILIGIWSDLNRKGTI